MAPAGGRRWWRAPDVRAVAVLVAVPLALFVVPALAGHPAIAGDNVIQNFPLRVLTGRQIRAGHLPLWNPYLWSGTPLLGGLNAGSAYPFTMAFVVLPAVAAWVVNLLGVYWAAGLGVYVLLRQYRVRPLPALLAGLTYAYAGAMAGQMVHLGVVEGMGWLPWMVLAQLRLSWSVLSSPPGAPLRRPVMAGSSGGGDPTTPPDGAPAVLVGYRQGSRWPWVVLLAATLGLVVLTGEPRAMADAEVVAGAVTLWLVLRPYPGQGVTAARRLAFLGWSALAAVWGIAISAVQVVPGWSFIDASQRSSESYWYFGSGSLHPSWTVLLLVPDLFGGDGILHQPPYFNSYNLPEVTGYVGLLPLVAAAALLGRSFGRRRDPRAADWALWLALGGLGLLLAWGAFTPLGHLFVHIPLFGKTRLQSRNLGIVDLALAVLFGFWADRALAAGVAGAGLEGWRRWLAAAPALAAGCVCVVAIALPGPLEQSFGTTAEGGSLGRDLTPWIVAQLVVAAAVVALVMGWRRLDRTARRRWLAAVVVVDVGLFMVSTSTGLTDGQATLEPSRAAATAVLGNGGRFAIFDTKGAQEILDQVGQPDLNVFTTLPSVQGYGSILGAGYGEATGTHTLDTLNPCALADGTFTQLRLSTLLTLPTFLAPPLATGQPAPPVPASCPGAPAVGTATRRTFALGQSVVVTSAQLVRVAGGGRRTPLRLGLVGAGGAVTWPAETVRATAGGWSVQLARPRAAVAVVVAGPARAVSPSSVVGGQGGQRWALDGILQDALSASGWRYAGAWGQYVKYVASSVRPSVWLAGAGAAAGGRARELSTTEWGTAEVRVTSSRPVTVVRSEAYLAGWRVSAVPAGGGPARSLAVRRDGLVQSVEVPPGTWTLTFLYKPKGLDAGLAATALGLAAMVVAAAWALVARRRG